MKTATYVEFSLLPVQSFISATRRTRDLWAASYLLSYLAGSAMKGAEEAGARVVQPRLEHDPLYTWIRGDGEGAPPVVGTLPNGFAAETDEPVAVAAAAVESFQDAWSRVCESVWAVLDDTMPPSSREIWDRQVSSYWQPMWAAGSSRGSLSRRRLWRSPVRPDEPEPGDKCTVELELQELSGVRSASTEDRAAQDGFWRSVRDQVRPLELGDRERLCAIALIKRLLPRVSREAFGWELDRSHWPSVVNVAAAPWCRRAAVVARDATDAYVGQLSRAAPRHALHAWTTAPSETLPLGQLDANYLHPATLADENATPIEGDDGVRERIRTALKGLTGSRFRAGGDEIELGAPPRFYGLLAADGDRLGELLIRGTDPDGLGEGLRLFTARVGEIVARNHGVTIYAGGDDALAMLPVDDADPGGEVRGALRCAADLRTAYVESMLAAGVEDAAATLSVGVTLAHTRLPLGGVVREAHRLLDDVAKEANGWDSIAASVLKPAGLHCVWVSSWTRPDGLDPVQVVARIMRALREDPEHAELGSGALYRVRYALGLLCGWPRFEPGQAGHLLAGLDPVPFVEAELERTIRDGSGAAVATRSLAEQILDLCRVYRSGDGERGPGGPVRIALDGILLAGFLSDPAEEEHL